MKKLLFLLCCIFSLSIQAQDIKWGTPYQADKQLLGLNLVGIIDNKLYMFGGEGSVLSLTRYMYIFDIQTLSLKEKVELKILKKDNDRLYPLGFSIVKSEIYVTYATPKYKRPFTQVYDKDMKFVEDKKEETEPSFAGRLVGYTSDGSKYIRMSGVEMSDIVVAWYDSTSHQEVKKQNYVSPFQEVAFDHISTELDAHENIYVLGKQYNSKAKIKRDEDGNITKKSFVVDETKRGKANYTHELLLLKPHGTQKKQTITFSETEFLKDVNGFVNHKGNYCVYGFYNDSAEDNARGFFVIVFDSDLNVIKKVKKDFDLEFIRSFNKKKAEAVKQFDMRAAISNQDNSIFILAESNYNIITTGERGSSTTFHRNDIMCIKLSQDMEIEFIKQIAKEQSGYVENLLSFVTISNGKEVRMIYSDHIKNRDIVSGKVIADGSALKSLFMVTIPANGEVSKKLLYEAHPRKLYVVTDLCHQLDENTLLICSYWKKEIMWGLLKIK